MKSIEPPKIAPITLRDIEEALDERDRYEKEHGKPNIIEGGAGKPLPLGWG